METHHRWYPFEIQIIPFLEWDLQFHGLSVNFLPTVTGLAYMLLGCTFQKYAEYWGRTLRLLGTISLHADIHSVWLRIPSSYDLKICLLDILAGFL